MGQSLNTNLLELVFIIWASLNLRPPLPRGWELGGAKTCRIFDPKCQNGAKLGSILWAVIKSTLGSEVAIPTKYQISAKGGT